eukprot:scaffold1.g5504.t1
MEWVKSKAQAFVDYCRHPALPYDKFNPSGDVDSPNKKLYAALAAEFLGLMFFQLYGGVAHEEVAAFGNGLTLAVLVWATANVSGGHLNPAVTLSTMITGHMHWRRGLAYMGAQYLGSIVGALLQVALIPEVHTAMGGAGPGCFTHEHGTPIRLDQLFGWELVMTFLLCAVVHAVAVSKPGFGNVGPLAVGFALFASAMIGGPMTGTALNPARVFAPTLVYNCYWNTVFIYILGEYMGGVICGILMLPLYGPGPEFGSSEDQPLAGMAELTTLGSKATERQGLIGVTATSGAGAPYFDARF